MDVLEQRTKRFTEGALLSVLLRLALPVMASITLQTLYQLVNAFWLGRVSSAAVAVVSVTTPLTLLLVVLGSGLSTAGLISPGASVSGFGVRISGSIAGYCGRPSRSPCRPPSNSRRGLWQVCC